MVTFKSKSFRTNLVIVFSLFALGGLYMFSSDPRSGFFLLAIHIGLLIGLIKKYDWIIGALRFWGLLLFGSGIVLFIVMLITLPDFLQKFIGALASAPSIIIGYYCLFRTSKYIEIEKHPETSQVGAP